MNHIESTDGNVKVAPRRTKKTARSTADEFYERLKQFKINNGYLLRLLDEGVTVGLSDDLKMKLYMTSDDVDLNLGGDDGEQKALRTKDDPTFGMTSAQKIRYEK